MLGLGLGLGVRVRVRVRVRGRGVMVRVRVRVRIRVSALVAATLALLEHEALVPGALTAEGPGAAVGMTIAAATGARTHARLSHLVISGALTRGGLRLTILARVLAVLAWLWVGLGLGLGSGLGLGLGLGLGSLVSGKGQV